MRAESVRMIAQHRPSVAPIGSLPELAVGYGVRMHSHGGRFVDATARRADGLQALYFRLFLDRRRTELAEDLAKLRVEPKRQAIHSGGFAAKRARREFRTVEGDLTEIDRMISRLDRRFGRMWQELGGPAELEHVAAYDAEVERHAAER